MDLGGLRVLALGLNFSAHGVDVTVTRPYPDAGEPIATRGIWVTQYSDALPASLEFTRQEPLKVMALRRDEVTTVPRGTVVLAPEVMNGPVLGWKVDGMVRVDTDHTRVLLVRYPDADV